MRSVCFRKRRLIAFYMLYSLTLFLFVSRVSPCSIFFPIPFSLFHRFFSPFALHRFVIFSQYSPSSSSYITRFLKYNFYHTAFQYLVIYFSMFFPHSILQFLVRLFGPFVSVCSSFSGWELIFNWAHHSSSGPVIAHPHSTTFYKSGWARTDSLSLSLSLFLIFLPLSLSRYRSLTFVFKCSPSVSGISHADLLLVLMPEGVK